MSASIIVVDDEPDVAELFRQRFRREAREGTYVMHFAASGEAALELLGGGIEPGVIVILSDINMPGMDGLQLLGEIKDKLFQPFFTTKPTGEGTGLGLSISWDIVTQQHGGTITVDSRPGEFTEFAIRLPRTRLASTTGMTA